MDSSVPKLSHQVSTVPTSSHNTESCCVNAPLEKVWPFFRDFKLHEVAPETVTNMECTSGAAGQVGSIVKISYANGSTWEVMITEISEKYHRICYQLVQAVPSIHCSSVDTEIEFTRCTFENETFFKWTTEFSNDADLQVHQDSKYKKHDFFGKLKKHFTK